MIDTKPKRRWFQFRLRSLLAIVTAVAVLCWAYLIGWPWWLTYRERIQFESAARQLKAGISTDAAIASLPTRKHLTTFAESQGHAVALTSFTLRESVYCIYYVILKPQPVAMPQWPCDSLEVFRLPHMPTNFQSQRKSLKPFSSLDTARAEQHYIEDFLTFISSDRKVNPGFQYELIHADAPTKPSAGNRPESSISD